MNDDQNDTVLTRELPDSLAALTATERPPPAAITRRGRVCQRRRLAGFAGIGVAGAVPDRRSIGVLSVRPPAKTAGVLPAPGLPKAGKLNVSRTVTVINPAAMPKGTRLFFGYFNRCHLVWVGLVYTRSYTCTDQPPRTGS